MKLPLRTSRSVRFTIALALGSVPVVAGCAAYVMPSDGGANDGARADTGADANSAACPPTLPTGTSGPCTAGLTCSYSGYRCYSDPYTIVCQCTATDGSATGTWSCGLCEGPLPPPELV